MASGFQHVKALHTRYVPFCPNGVPASVFLAALSCSYHRKIISQSDGHSVVNSKIKKPLHRHQKSAGALLSLQNDVLCNGFEIQNHTVFMSARRWQYKTAFDGGQRYFLLAYRKHWAACAAIPFQEHSVWAERKSQWNAGFLTTSLALRFDSWLYIALFDKAELSSYCNKVCPFIAIMTL